ncbi:hypothetical protein F0562_023318 [Nyssa sinensis]|uniref:Uncharacterized protein n=1 Tax=Nyssa sinensis TaxID=561372 RepID=A0A5J5BHP4_9ASTE|nr:hypothetical protein F0562_023318 [Nyssa sinensis]
MPEAEVLKQFVPYMQSGTEVIRDEQLTIQVNLFNCVSLAIGIFISHRIADGHSLITFINAWAAMASGKSNLVCPSYNSSSLFPPRDSSWSRTEILTLEKLVTRRFVFSASKVAALKAKVAAGSCLLQQPTLNLRGMMFTALPEYSSRNLIRSAYAAVDGETELASLVEASRVNQSEISYQLRRSLSDALTQFYPLAGRMKGDSSVVCNDEGVGYVEARVDGELSDIITQPEIEILNLFLPYKLNDSELSMEEQLGIQVNLLNCGGIVLGICISHRIADAHTLSIFIKGWAATMRGENNLVCPSFVSASLFPPRDPLGFKPQAQVPAEGVVTRRFVFSASTIAALQAEVINSLGIVQPTRVQVVSALIWKCAVAQTGLNKCSASVVFHPVNLRRRMDPPLPEYSFGNIFQMVNAAVTDGKTELAALVAKLKAAFEEIDSNYIKERQGENGCEVIMSNFREIGKLVAKGEVQVVKFSSWCGFPIYEADFGWGKPIWVSSAGCATNNAIFLMDSRWAGGIEAWVSMYDQDMAKFEQHPELQSLVSSFPIS